MFSPVRLRTWEIAPSRRRRGQLSLAEYIGIGRTERLLRLLFLDHIQTLAVGQFNELSEDKGDKFCDAMLH